MSRYGIRDFACLAKRGFGIYGFSIGKNADTYFKIITALSNIKRK